MRQRAPTRSPMRFGRACRTRPASRSCPCPIRTPAARSSPAGARICPPPPRQTNNPPVHMLETPISHKTLHKAAMTRSLRPLSLHPSPHIDHIHHRWFASSLPQMLPLLLTLHIPTPSAPTPSAPTPATPTPFAPTPSTPTSSAPTSSAPTPAPTASTPRPPPAAAAGRPSCSLRWARRWATTPAMAAAAMAGSGTSKTTRTASTTGRSGPRWGRWTSGRFRCAAATACLGLQPEPRTPSPEPRAPSPSFEILTPNPNCEPQFITLSPILDLEP